MGIKEHFKYITYRIENNFFLRVIRHGLAMMIPVLLIGGVACALINLPFVDYSVGWLLVLHKIFNTVYQATFGLFSLILVITLSLSYGMEKNETIDKIAMYIAISLGAYGVQIGMGIETFAIDDFGVTGCSSSIIISMLSCVLYDKLKKLQILSLKKYTMGMESICVTAISAMLPMVIVLLIMGVMTNVLDMCFGVYSVHDLFAKMCHGIFDDLHNSYESGAIYTFLLHLFWLLGFHGSHLLEPVAQSNYANVTSDVIFSKSFFDTYVVMGGCGTTICVLLVLLIFYRKDRLGNLAKIGSFTVIFNLNEIINLGLPIMLNPIMAIPFLATPLVCYSVAYGATALGLVPHLVRQVPWSTPILLSGYVATDSWKGVVLQVVCILIGMAIYYPFIKINKKMQEIFAREQLKSLITELQHNEEENKTPKFLSRADSLGMISRMLLEDLKLAIKEKKLYMLYQPQVDNAGKCLGAEALLRWEHPLYGFIYPPLIIYLAKEGDILPLLEEQVFDMSAEAIKKTKEAYDGKFKISVNITGKSLQWDIEACIEKCLEKYDIQPDYMWVEITEQDVISKTDSTISKLQRLKNLGHTLLIDDFGMGHTSLVYLQSNYFGVVKLDGSLVKNILKSKTNQKIVASIVDLGKELDIRIIAEYVETQEHWDKLKELGCDWYQGYLFSKPIPLDDFIEYIKKANQSS